MAVTRINNNQITDANANVYFGINAASKLQNYSVTSTKLANSLVYGSDLTVSGNLTVNGTTTTIDTVNTLIEDPIITLADGQTTGTPLVDIGSLGLRGNQLSSFIGWNEGNTEFAVILSNTTSSNTTVEITEYGNFHANSVLVGGNLSVAGNITGSFNLTGNLTAGNLFSTGIVSAVSNVIGGNVTTVGLVTATGNVTGGNINTTGLASVTGNVIGGNVSTVGLVTATGNVTGGNINTAGLVSAVGNVIGGNVTTVGLISATGNIDGGNINFGAGIVSGTGNIYADTIFANISGNIDAAGSNTEIQYNGPGDQLAANANFTYDYATNLMTVNGGNIATGNLSATGAITATANINGGNILTGGLISATGNITTADTLNTANISLSGNVISPLNVTGNTTSGNLLTPGIVSATGNVTGGNINTAGLASVTGNVIGGNISTVGLITATGNVYGGQIVSNTITNSSGSITISSPGDINLAPTGNIDASGAYINNVSDPVLAQDAATKQYVDDSVSSGITIHTPVLVESPTALNATYTQGGTTATVTDTVAGNTVVFSTTVNPQVNDQYWFTNSFNGIVGNTAYFVVSAPNTSAAVLSTTYNGAPVSNITGGTGLTQPVRINSGVGATLTNAGANATLVVDGVTLANTNRVLVYTQANAVHNGVYVVSEAGNATTAWELTRSTDTDTYGPKSTDELDVGDYFYVQSGDTGAGESYVMTAPTGTFIIGYNNLTFTQFSASQVYTANTSAGLSLSGTVFSAKVDNNTTAFDGGGNIIVKAGANLTTPNIGAATGTSLSVTGTVTANTNISAVGNVIAGNVTTVGLISAIGNVTGGNLLTTGLVSATGNGTFGNIDTVGLITAVGNITGGNLITSNLVQGGTVSASGNVIGGNVNTSGLVTATGNVTGGNINTAGLVSATGNVIAGNVTTVGLISAVGNITGGNLITSNLVQGGTVSASGNVIGGNITTVGLITATGNITGGNVLTSGLISAAGNATVGNIDTVGLITAVGNITGGNLITSNLVQGGTVSASGNVIGGNITTVGLITATGNITGGNVIGVTSGQFGNIVISGDDITDTNGIVNINSAGADVNFAVNGDTTANILFIDAGTGTGSFGSSTQTTNAIVAFNSPTSILLPTGNLAQRPSTGVTGMFRFNTTNNSLEVYNNSEWKEVGSTTFTVIADEQFNGDGSTVAFTLASTQTTNSCIVSINGIVQIPGTAYSVSGTDPTCVLTFTEAPAPGDIIDVREITTTTTVDALANGSGNAEIKGSATAAQFDLTGNIIPTANVTYSLGNSTNRFSNIYLSGSTIFLGNIQLKVAAGNSLGIYQADGTTPANIASTSVDTTQILNGNSNVQVLTSSGNVAVHINSNRIVSFTAGGIENNMGNGVGNIGNSTGYFNTIFAKATSAQYADLAEKYVADADYAPGTVLSFGGDKEVTKSAKDSDRAVAGVVSTNPSYIMNGTLEAEHVATIALTGRVPTSVTGTVAKGDLMVSNGDGTARAEADPKAGAIIGKALENFAGGTGIIEVVIGRF